MVWLARGRMDGLWCYWFRGETKKTFHFKSLSWGKKLQNLKEQASIIWSNTFKSQRNSENEGKKLMQSVDTGFIFIVLSLQALVACKDHSCSFAEASRHRGHCSVSAGSCEWWQIEWNWPDDLSPAWSIRDTCACVCVCVCGAPSLWWWTVLIWCLYT